MHEFIETQLNDLETLKNKNENLEELDHEKIY